MTEEQFCDLVAREVVTMAIGGTPDESLRAHVQQKYADYGIRLELRF